MSGSDDSISMDDLRGSRVLRRGDLVKQGHFRKNWRRRLFVLTDEEIAYYDGKKLRGAILLSDVEDVRGVVDDDGKRSSFEIRTGKGKHYTLIASTEVEKDDWMRAIHAAMGATDAAFTVGDASASSPSSLDSAADEYRAAVTDARSAGDAPALSTALRRLEDFFQASLATGIVPRAVGDAVHPCREELGALRRAQAGVWSAEHEAQALRIGAALDSAQRIVDEFMASAAGAGAARGQAAAGDGAASVAAGAAPDAGAGAGSAGGAGLEDVSTRRRGVSIAAIGQGVSFNRHGSVCEPTREKFDAQYTLGEELGRGSYSVVRQAVHVKSQQTFAVKIIDRSKLSKHDKEALENEVSIMCQLNHPNIVQLHAYFEEGDVCYLVTEVVDGGELFDRIVDKRYYSERLARDLVRTLVDTLGYCHRQGIVHRDLKPENILLASKKDDAQIKIADFGFARKISTGGLTTDCGSPWYVAPEILSGRAYGASVDLWSIGVITFILLCGYPPFHHNNQAILFQKIKAAQYSFDQRYWSAVSSDAKDLISGLLQVDPRERLSVEGVLNHPWIKSSSVSTSALTGALSELKTFNARRRNVLKQGFLVKQGGIIKSWKRRSFVLTPDSLSYYETEQSARPRGRIDLSSITSIEDVKGKGDTPGFRIHTQKGRKYLIQAGSEKEKSEWMSTLENVRRGSRLLGDAKAAVDRGDIDAALTAVLEARATPGMFRDQRLLRLWARLGESTERAGCRVWLQTAFEPAHSARVTSVAAAMSAPIAVTGSWDNSVVVWDLDTGTQTRHLRRHTDMVTDVSVFADGQSAVSASADRTLCVWDLKSGNVRTTLEGHTDTVTCVAVGEDGRLAVSGSWDKTVRLWSIAEGKCTKKMTGHAGSVTAVALSANGSWCVSGAADHAVVLWNLDRGAMSRVLKGHRGAISAVSLTADLRNILSASVDGTVRLWDVARATEQEDLPAPRRGKERGMLLRATGAVRGHSGAVHSMAVSRDGKWAYLSADDCSLTLWDLDTGSAVNKTTFAEEAECVRMTPDHSALLCTQGNNIEVWALDWSLRHGGRDFDTVPAATEEDSAANKLAHMALSRAKSISEGGPGSPHGAGAGAGAGAGVAQNPLQAAHAVRQQAESGLIPVNDGDGNTSDEDEDAVAP